MLHKLHPSYLLPTSKIKQPVIQDETFEKSNYSSRFSNFAAIALTDPRVPCPLVP